MYRVFKLEFGDIVGFFGGTKTGVSREKCSEHG